MEKLSGLNEINTRRKGNISIEYCQKRGGLITGIEIDGKQIFYMDRDRFTDPDKSIRGGIPVMYPRAGPVTHESDICNLPQHGFARSRSWKKTIENSKKLSLLLSTSNDGNYPYDNEIEVIVGSNEDSRVDFDYNIFNNSDKEMPISMGLHPYFPVKHEEKGNIVFNFLGSDGTIEDTIRDNIGKWSNGKSISIANPRVLNPNVKIQVNIPGLGLLEFDIDPKFERIWLRSEPSKDFVCIEPVMGDSDTIIDGDAHMIAAGEQFHLGYGITLLQENH